MMRLALFPLCSVIAPAASLAADAEPPVTASASVDKKICRAEEVTGSNIRETNCLTKAEWTALDKQHEIEIWSLRDGTHWNSTNH
jgi:hypothetical protein